MNYTFFRRSTFFDHSILDMPRGVVRLHWAMADHDGTRIKRLDLVDGGEPVAQPLTV
jgi:hypothetical protein